MPGNYSKLVTVITGQTITAAERNNEFDNVINNMTPDGVDDASTNLAAMQATVDPSGGSLATALRGEIQRIRFQLSKLGSASGNWYDALPFLAGLTPAAPGATATDLNNRIAQLAKQLLLLNVASGNWYDALAWLAAITPATPGATATDLTNRLAQIISYLNSITGGAWPTPPAKTLLQYLALSGGTLTDNLVFNPTTKGVKGTTNADDAAAGNVGEYVSSVVASVNFPATTVYGNLAAIVLTAGDWDVSALVQMTGGTTVQSWSIGISTTTGNSQAGLTAGDNQLSTLAPNVPSVTNAFACIPSWRTPGGATIYLKFAASYSSGTPSASARLSARRVR